MWYENWPASDFSWLLKLLANVLDMGQSHCSKNVPKFQRSMANTEPIMKQLFCLFVSKLITFHSASWLLFCFRLFVFLCVFFSRNSCLHLQNKYIGSEDSSCRYNATFAVFVVVVVVVVVFFSHCFIYPWLFSANTVPSSLNIITTRASSPAPIVKSSEKRSLLYDLVSSCFPKSLFSWS